MDQILALLEKLREDAGRSRQKSGIADDLRRLIRTTDFTKLHDKQIQSLLHSLYANVKIERNTYINSKSAGRSSHALRLALYGQGVLLIIEKSMSLIRLKTIKNFIHHLMEILPVVQEILLAPLAQIYLRTLQKILNTSVHLEHFDHDIWLELVIFCVNSIECYEYTRDEDGSDIDDKASKPSCLRQSPNVKSEVIALFTCLSTLLSWSAMQLSNDKVIAKGLIQRLCALLSTFARLHVSENGAHYYVVLVIRHVLGFAICNDRDVSISLTNLAIIMTTNLWRTRNPLLRDEMLECLTLGVPYFALSKGEKGMLRLARLYQQISTSVLQIPVRQQLQVSDMISIISENFSIIQDQASYNKISRDGPHRQKTNVFLSISLLGSLSELLLSSSDFDSQSGEVYGSARKRPRLIDSSGIPLYAADLLLDSDESRVLLGLQIMTMSQQPRRQQKDVCNRAKHLLSSDSSEILSWTYMLFSVHGRFSPSKSVTDTLYSSRELYEIALKGINSSVVGDGAASLALSLLEKGALSSDVLALGCSTAHSLQTQGPPKFSSTGCRFIVAMSDSLLKFNLIDAADMTDAIAGWVRARILQILVTCHDEQVLSLLDFIENLTSNGNSERSLFAVRSLRDDASAQQLVQNILPIYRSPSEALEQRARTSWKIGSQSILQQIVLLLEKRSAELLRTVHDDDPDTRNLSLVHGIMFVLTFIKAATYLQTNDYKMNNIRALTHAIMKQSDEFTLGNDAQALVARGLASLASTLLYSSHQISTVVIVLLPFLKSLLNSVVRSLRSIHSEALLNSEDFDDNPTLDSDKSSMPSTSLPAVPEDVVQIITTIALLIDHFQDDAQEPTQLSKLCRQADLGLISKLDSWHFWTILPCCRLDSYALELLKFLTEDVLPDYHFERRQAVFAGISGFLMSTRSLWTSDKDDEISRKGQKVFQWLLRLVLVARLGSCDNRVLLVQLCEAVLIDERNSTKAIDTGEGIPSLRSILVQAVNDDDLRVSLEAARACMSIFASHDFIVFEQIFQDISTILTTGSNCKTRSGLKCFTFTLLALKDELLLSLALINILEVCLTESMSTLAQQSINFISTELGIPVKALFSRYERNLLWMWMERFEIVAFPFTAFQFASLQEFLESFSVEIAAQLLAAGHLDQFAHFCNIIDMTEVEVVESVLELAEAYIAIRLDCGQQFDGRRFLKQILGTARYNICSQRSDKLYIDFQLLEGPLSCTRYLMSTKFAACAKAFGQMLEYVGLADKTPRSEALQLSSKLFCKKLVDDNLSLDSRSIMKIARFLFKSLQIGTGLQQVIILQKLCLLISFQPVICLAQPVCSTLLTGLSGLLYNHKLSRPKHTCALLMLHLLRCTSDEEIFVSGIGQQALLLCCLFLDDPAKRHHRKDIASIMAKCDEHLRGALDAAFYSSDSKVSSIRAKVDLVSLCCRLTPWHLRSAANSVRKHFSSVLENRLAASDYDSQDLLSKALTLVSSRRGSEYPLAVTFTNRILALSLLNDCAVEDEYQMASNAHSNTPRTTAEIKNVLIEELLAALHGFDPEYIGKAESTLCKLMHTCPKALQECRNVDMAIIRHLPDTDRWDVPITTEAVHTVPDLRFTICDFESWLFALVNYLLSLSRQDPFFAACAEMFSQEVDFACRNVGFLFQACVGQYGSEQTSMVSVLFRYIELTFRSYQNVSTQHIATCASIIQALRNVETSSKTGVSIISFLGELDFLCAAQATCHHKMVPEALLYLEMYSLQDRNLRESKQFRETQLLIYSISAETDSFYGVESTKTALSAALDTADHEHGGWKSLPLHTAFRTAERKLGHAQNDDSHELTSIALRDLGLDTITLDLQRGTRQSSDVAYQSAWFLEQWNIPFTSLSSPGPRQNLYQTLCNLSRLDWQEASKVQQELTVANERFALLHHDSGIRPVLAVFQELQELISAFQTSLVSVEHLLLNKWQTRSKVLYKHLDFAAYEMIIASRQVFLSLVRKQNGLSHDILSMQLNMLLVDYEKCADARSYQASLNAITFAEQLVSSSGYECPANLYARLKALTAEVLWRVGDVKSSIKLSQELIISESSGSRIDSLLSASNLLELGLRCASGRLEKPSDIAQKYLVPAIHELGDNRSDKAGQMYLRFASFCHDQLDDLDSSEDYQTLLRLRAEKAKELHDLEAAIDSCIRPDDKKRLLTQQSKATSLYELDHLEISAIEQSREIYLARSIEGFLRAFAYTDEGDTLVSRCTTLWFANCTNSNASQVFEECVPSVPSHKFLVLLNQFLARLSSSRDAFQQVLSDLLCRIARDHPYHALYVMYAVQYSKRSGDETAKDRARAVSKIMQTLMANSHELEILIASVKIICSNYVVLAQSPVNKKDFPAKDIPFSAAPNHRIFTKDFKDLKLPPLTLRIEPRLSRDYSDIPRIHGYEPSFRLAGGISAPKVVRCRMTDGKFIRELVKGGNDDLRQDVVMQQVFSQVDDLFKRNRETSKRNLKIRTYRVLPLSTNSGVLEWVMDTVPMQDLLQPLHLKYRPDDWDYAMCRKQIADVAKRSRTTRVAVFKTVMQRCQPVMRHAFLDMFSDVVEWYNAQLAYTRSTAAISILGHVLGLGDRHLHNIILDRKTGEVVHIDLGIAFEQGRTLPIPERVPFRLTRDIVDGMGILGTEGVFRRCCEFTLEMMRAEQASIKSILDVLKHDPLYSWTLSPLRRLGAQLKTGDESVSSRVGAAGGKVEPEVGSEASRALLVVERKLSSTLSVSAVVNELIQQATDTENLALIFAGWAAWY